MMPSLRERSARLLRACVYLQLVEAVLTELATDGERPQWLRARVVRQLAQLWVHRLTWRVAEFFPVLEATWEARSQVRVAGGAFLGTSEMFQLMTKGGDPAYVDLLMLRARRRRKPRVPRVLVRPQLGGARATGRRDGEGESQQHRTRRRGAGRRTRRGIDLLRVLPSALAGGEGAAIRWLAGAEALGGGVCHAGSGSKAYRKGEFTAVT